MTHNNGKRDITRIVLADDHTMVRQGMRRLLEDKNGFKIVGEAPDGLEALRLVSELRPDVLITDLRMPGMNGIELIRKVKESFPEIRVVVISMYGAEAYVCSALSAGASAYVLKQPDIQNLDTAIRKVVQGENYLSPVISRTRIDGYRLKNDEPPLTL